MEKTAQDKTLFVLTEETATNITLKPNPNVHDVYGKLEKLGFPFEVTKIVVNKILKGDEYEIRLYHMTNKKMVDDGSGNTSIKYLPRRFEDFIAWSNKDYSKKYLDMKQWNDWTKMIVGFARDVGVNITEIDN